MIMLLARLWRALWRRRVSVVTKHDTNEAGSRRADARARFWADLRDGQREAEARAAALATGRHKG